MEKEINVQVKDNSPSIERILRPISYTSWLLGVGVAHPRKCHKTITIIIRIFYVTVCSICMIYHATYIFSRMQAKEIEVIVYMHWLCSAIIYVSIYYYIIHGIRLYKWTELMDRLKQLDQKIRKEISMNDDYIKIVEALAIYVTICFPSIFIAHCISYLPYYHEWTRFLVEITLYGLILAQSLINNFIFDIIVYVLYCRFQTINKLIGELDKLSDVLAFKIRRIREMHTDICDLVNIVNDIYGLHLLLCFMYCFTTAVTLLFQFYQMYTFSDYKTRKNYYQTLVINIFLCIVNVTQFYLICWICTLASQESNKTGRIIYEIILKCKPVNLDKHEANNQSNLEMRSSLEDSNGEQNSNCSSSHNLNYVVLENLLHKHLDRDCVRNEVNDFSIQLQQNRVAFTACNFFEINNALFRNFVGLIITNLIIISQLDQSNKDVRKLQTVILEMEKKMFSKENQTDSQN